MQSRTTEISSHSVSRQGHTTHYLAAGPEEGPLIVMVHGWPELSLSWRHQLPVLGGLGFRAVAPDMRGYGRSSVYAQHEDYAQELVVGDMLNLLEALNREQAVWVGHDWGSPTVWNIASHHPQQCRAVASLCVPYWNLERGLEHVIQLVDRAIYPEAEFPAGQWDYQLYYLENFEAATKAFEANPYNTAKLLFRKGDPAGFGKPAATALVRANGGWFGGGTEVPDFPMDEDVVTDDDLNTYAEALGRNGFFGPDSYYMNHAANEKYADKAVNGGRLDMPVLFIAAEYDYVCETISSNAADPMRKRCSNLEEAVVKSGHWMAQEKPRAVNAILVSWLARQGIWPTGS